MIDMTGQRFGKLIVVRLHAEKLYGGVNAWVCQCDCGNETVQIRVNLTKGRSRSCGCYRHDPKWIEGQRKGALKHGGLGTPEHNAFRAMMSRCHYKSAGNYPEYGGRGIVVCEKWHNNFANFLADMGPKPTPQYTLDRFPNPNGIYEPSNCRWATHQEQQANKNNTVWVSAFGKRLIVADWARETGLPRGVIGNRIRLGWPPERALTEPIRKH